MPKDLVVNVVPSGREPMPPFLDRLDAGSDAADVAHCLARYAGEAALGFARCRAVELTAQGDRTGAAFWRAILRLLEHGTERPCHDTPDRGNGVRRDVGGTGSREPN